MYIIKSMIDIFEISCDLYVLNIYMFSDKVPKAEIQVTLHFVWEVKFLLIHYSRLEPLVQILVTGVDVVFLHVALGFSPLKRLRFFVGRTDASGTTLSSCPEPDTFHFYLS